MDVTAEKMDCGGTELLVEHNAPKWFRHIVRMDEDFFDKSI